LPALQIFGSPDVRNYALGKLEAHPTNFLAIKVKKARLRLRSPGQTSHFSAQRAKPMDLKRLLINGAPSWGREISVEGPTLPDYTTGLYVPRLF
jgi:hypothetical protein